MDVGLARRLIEDDDPLAAVWEILTTQFWTSGCYDECQKAGTLDEYLQKTEREVSDFEHDLWRVFRDVYSHLEAPHPRKKRTAELLEQSQFTLVIFDALSIREMPALLSALSELGLSAEADYALAPVPTTTEAFAQAFFGASGPSAMAKAAGDRDFAFAHMKRDDKPPDFDSQSSRRVVWSIYPDDRFNSTSESLKYGEDIVEPVLRTLRNVLEAEPVFPVVITSDHGYLWQGPGVAWRLPDGEYPESFARAFKGGRCGSATDVLDSPQGLVWKEGDLAAVRGRFTWSYKVAGAKRWWRHEGVSLHECLAPWISVPVA